MSPCKSYQGQIALLAAQALEEHEQRAVLDHLNHCPACQTYRNQLQGVVGLYTLDAERPVRPASHPLSLRPFEPKRVRWIALPRAAMVAAAVVVFGGALLLLLRERPDDTFGQPTPITQDAKMTNRDGPISIADARRLAGRELDDIINADTLTVPQRADFVFSAGMRHEGP